VKRKKVILETEESFARTELHKIIVEFGLAMQSAHYGFIANTGKMTERMLRVWGLYREWCQNNK